jgi:hypothetical protein
MKFVHASAIHETSNAHIHSRPITMSASASAKKRSALEAKFLTRRCAVVSAHRNQKAVFVPSINATTTSCANVSVKIIRQATSALDVKSGMHTNGELLISIKLSYFLKKIIFSQCECPVPMPEGGCAGAQK